MEEVKKIKMLILGSGPAGLTCAIYAARANLAPVVAAGAVEDGLLKGGQLMITTEVENYPGFPEGIMGPELMDKFIEQAKRFGAVIVESTATEFNLKPGGPFRVRVGNDYYEASTLVVATGATARWMGLPDEEKYKNKGISACATCDGPLPMFRKQHLIVVGGGDTAIEEALFLTRFAEKVTIVHRRDQLRASKIMQQRALSNPKIKFEWNTVIAGYKGAKVLESVVLSNMQTGVQTEVPCKGVFMAIGHEPSTKYLKGSGLHLDHMGYVAVDRHIYTNIDGVFCAGDVHDTHYRQAVTAAGFGCMAAIAAERWLEAKDFAAANAANAAL